MSQYIYALWRRKSSIATLKLHSKWSWKHMLRVGQKVVDVKSYFGGHEALYLNAISPLSLLWPTYMTMFDSEIVIIWWWVRWQSDAIKLAFARAIIEFNDEYKSVLKPYSMLKRDSRIKERKKPGLKKARKAPTRSKR